MVGYDSMSQNWTFALQQKKKNVYVTLLRATVPSINSSLRIERNALEPFIWAFLK